MVCMIGVPVAFLTLCLTVFWSGSSSPSNVSTAPVLSETDAAQRLRALTAERNSIRAERDVLHQKINSLLATGPQNYLHSPPARRSAASSVVTPPLSILVTGHKQGTMWFLGLIQKVIESDERVVLCPPPKDGRYRHGVGGMWRWAADPNWFKDWKPKASTGHMETCKGFAPPMVRSPTAVKLQTSPTHSLMASFDLGGKDLDLLAQDCVPGYVNAYAKRTDDLGGCSQSSTPFAMVRILRDPRDVIVSGYHHHKRCAEPWTKEADKLYGGISYCELLNKVTETSGLKLEIRLAGRKWLNQMLSTVRLLKRRPELMLLVKFIRYEDLWTDLNTTMAELGRHLFPTSLSVAAHFSQIATEATQKKWDSVRKPDGFAASDTNEGWQNQHMRSGKPYQWKTRFKESHIDEFQELGLEEIVEFFGYEPTQAILSIT